MLLGAEVELEDCVFTDSSLVLVKANLTAVKTRFHDAVIDTHDKARVTLDRCQFIGLNFDIFTEDATALFGEMEVEISVHRSLFSGYKSVFVAQHSNTKISLQQCVADVDHIGFVRENANVSFTDSLIGTRSCLLGIEKNVEGKLKFKGNKPTPQTRPIFFIDRISREPQHYLENVQFASRDPSPLAVPTSKEKSDYTKAARKRIHYSSSQMTDPLLTSFLKFARNVGKWETRLP